MIVSYSDNLRAGGSGPAGPVLAGLVLKKFYACICLRHYVKFGKKFYSHIIEALGT